MKIKCTRKFHHHVSSMKIKHRIVFKKRVASDCRTHKLFILTIFYIYIKMKYLFIIYNKQYIFVYCDIYLYYILYIYIYLSIKHCQCMSFSTKVFVCVVSVYLFIYIHLSGYISFTFNFISATKLSATAGPPMPSQKL